MRKTLFLLTLAMMVVPGCGVTTFVPPEEDAVVDEHVYYSLGLITSEEAGVRALSTKAERRLVLMDRYKKKKSKDKYDEDENGEYELKVCAESHPEATQSLNSDFKLEGEVENIDITKFLRALETKVKSTFTRSQGLQFYRDGAFQLCQAYFNGLITKSSHHGSHPCPNCFLDQLNALRKDAVNIILHEIQGGFYRQKRDEEAKKDAKKKSEKPTPPTLLCATPECPLCCTAPLQPKKAK